MCISTWQVSCPTYPARMPRTSRRWWMSSARSCKTSSAPRSGITRPLVQVLVGEVVERLGEPDGIIAFDPSSFPKRGTHSVGVKRQWCGHRGKVDNCQVGVFMGYVSRRDHALLDFRLSLPGDWARDPKRRAECHVPEEVQYRTRQDQCLEMLDLWGEQIPHGWVTGDDELGRHSRLRHALRERGERSVLGVPCTTTIRDLEGPWPAYQGRGRPPKPPWQSVTVWRHALAPEAASELSGCEFRQLA
jgi:SRSO17 transposase